MLEHTLINITIRIDILSKPVRLTILIRSFMSVAISIADLSLAMWLASQESTFITISIT
jgi:hypothetical protein